MNTKSNNSLTDLPHPQLLNRFGDLVRCDRRCTAELLGVIAEIDRRKLWAAHACPSMFAFCVEHFHMSEAVAAKRIWAARTARRFPVIFAKVARGDLHLSAIQQLARHLTDDNHRALLDQATHKTSREIEVLVAEIAPKPDVPSRIRALPRRAEVQTSNSIRAGAEQRSVEIDAKITAVQGADVRGQSLKSPSCEGFATATLPPLTTAATPAVQTADQPTTSRPAPITTAASRSQRTNKSVVALAPRRYKLQITIDQETHDQLRMLEDLTNHRSCGADPALIVSQALKLLLADTLKKKAALTDRPRSGRSNGDESVATPTRAIPAVVRREVWRRDRGRCAFVDDAGQRCKATRAVEYHHIVPYGKGGKHESSNIALRCRPHNQHQADLDFGAEFMDQKRRGSFLHATRHV
jgi:hypothetical protein